MPEMQQPVVGQAETPERWLPVVGYESTYEVSDLGKVRRVVGTLPTKNPLVRRIWFGGLLKPTENKWGYLTVHLSSGNRSKTSFVHKLVLDAFVGPCPNGMECRHFPDQNPKNNVLGNISWATNKANQNDRISNGTDPRGERAGCAKLTWEIVRQIRSEYKPRKWGHGTHSLAKKYGVSQSAIHCIVSGKTWKETLPDETAARS